MTTLWFGRPGEQIQIEHPRDGVQGTRDRPSSTFRTGTGGARVGQAIGGKRQYILRWERLWYETYAALEGYFHGHEGPGPFVLHDPGRINWLTVNQSGATSRSFDVDGFGTDNGGQGASGYGFTSNLSSSATAYHRGPRSLRWYVDNAAPAGSGNLETLQLLPATPTWPGIPVVPDLQMCFSAWVHASPVDPIDTLTLQMVWLDKDGGTISTVSGSSVVPSSSWAQAYVTGTPPATAAYVLCRVVAFGLAMAARTAVIHLDEFQLERGALPTDWRPGTGVFPVQVTALSERWPWQASDYREQVVMVLQEAGPG